MTTKKADTNKDEKGLERGRFSRLLAPGSMIEVEPSKKRTVAKMAKVAKPKPAGKA